jgi:hypothetical protein
VATGWRNVAPIGQPPQFVVTEWRDPTPQERKGRGVAKPAPAATAQPTLL